MMEYVYAGMWFLIGFAADLEAEKEKPGFCIRRRDFLVYGRLVAGGCPAAPADLFGGVYAWIFRGVMAAALIVTGLVFFRQKRRDAEQRALEEEESGAEDAADEESGGDSSED